METGNQEKPFRWYLFYQDRLVLEQHGEDTCSVPYGPCPPLDKSTCTEVVEVTTQAGQVVKAVRLATPPEPLPHGWTLTGLRASYDVLPYAHYLEAGKAYQLLHWDSHSRFCPSCGVPTVQQTPIMKQCPQCGYELYPPISTAIIVLVKRGEDELLLVHARNFKGTFYGLVAGFLEAGETLEQCVEREVMEETGLTIRHIRYIASQSWPYPSGLMVGFTAEYVSGTIKLQEDELSRGAFYHRDHLPEIPKKLSIARRLIDAWLRKEI